MHPLVDSADAGLCLRVLHEPPSHGRDSAQVGGHATPAVLCGNRCAVLCNPMPANNEFLHGVWTVIIFDLMGFGWTLVCVFANPTVCCVRQGIDHPNSVSDTR